MFTSELMKSWLDRLKPTLVQFGVLELCKILMSNFELKVSAVKVIISVRV